MDDTNNPDSGEYNIPDTEDIDNNYWRLVC